MKFKISNTRYDDSFIIEGNDIKEVREKTKKVLQNKGWNEDDCFSEQIGE